jgi:cardiolipin synthase A/B
MTMMMMKTNKAKTTHTDSDEIIFTEGDSYFSSLINDINMAKKSIHLEMYIYQNDSLGDRINDALMRAANSGVKIKVLVDACGSPYWGFSADQLEKHNIETKVYHPFPWQLWNWSRSVSKLPFLVKWIYFLFKIMKRNHRKVCLIDEKIAYIGGMNISKDHLSYHEGGNNWQDIGLRLNNRDLSEVKHAFEITWHGRDLKELLKETFKKIQNDPAIRLNNSWHRRRVLYKHLIKKLGSAKKRIWIINAYFVPDNMLLKSLVDAAKTNIDVKIILPRKADVLIPVPWVSSTFYENLLKNNIKIYEYKPHMLHSKVFIIDDWVIVGSSNLDHFSLLHNLEIDLKISKQENKRIVENHFGQLLNESNELNLKNWKIHRPWHQRLIGKIFLYLKYWI